MLASRPALFSCLPALISGLHWFASTVDWAKKKLKLGSRYARAGLAGGERPFLDLLQDVRHVYVFPSDLR